MKFPGEFERAAALSFLIIFGDMCGENAGFLKEQALALAVKNPFPVPPSPGNPAGFQKAGLLPSKNDSFFDGLIRPSEGGAGGVERVGLSRGISLPRLFTWV